MPVREAVAASCEKSRVNHASDVAATKFLNLNNLKVSLS
jgi:hypothetical protein